MPKPLELIGQRFGRLTVQNRDPIKTLSGNIRWNCLCDCGNKTTVAGGDLTSRGTTSCGCYNREIINKVNSTHGMSYLSEHGIWMGMIQRCTNKNNSRYSDYGGRGITVCDRWLNSFEAFYQDMGPRPSPDHSIDRRENDKGYYKENCYWATREEQQNNRKNNVFYTYSGNQYNIHQLAQLPEAKINGLNEDTIYARINQYRYSVEKALNIPNRRR